MQVPANQPRDLSAPTSVKTQGGAPVYARPADLERRRYSREYWVHILLFAFAVSLVVHISMMLSLWWYRQPAEAERRMDAPVEINLASAQEPVTPNEDVELPDPSPLAAGEIMPDPDEIPALSADLASGDPTQNSFGMIEAPGPGGIVGSSGPGQGIGIGSGRGGGGTSFFGVGGRGTRFAFIVDVSGSMQMDDRFVVAMTELKRSIAALPDFASLYVVLFSDDRRIPDWEESWIRATRGNILRMKKWLEEQAPGGGTYPMTSFERVFELPASPDVIFFLTDGEIPGDGPSEITRLNHKQRRASIINTICFGSESGRAGLEEIARENEGVFRYVPVTGGVRITIPAGP
ncbi:MAG: hypothetical protein EXS10_02295 [Phycisphaerales bacterium]|nr:hypothetical protein [Phycisphaerales bacterium]